ENNSDTVRRCTLGESLYDRVSMRILRPTEGLPDSLKNKTIDQAIRYAEKQLGRPYDYAFTNENKGNGLSNAFYCSELAYLAYASPEGADFELPLKKSTDRDKLLVAIESAVDSLQPKDKPALMAKAMKFVAVQDPPRPLRTSSISSSIRSCQTARPPSPW
ncbi:MAG: YiiX/YebB-like N1pC/P60 family cysteine hydrolase, partial [Bacteroidota bacterium]